MKVFYTALILSVFISPITYAWGPTGHRVVGRVADNHLSMKAKEKLNKILNGESLAEVSTWGDNIKSNKKFDHMLPWHYTKRIHAGKYVKTPKDKEKDIIEIINEYEARFKKGEFTPMHVKMYVHFVGDLHQPLHAGRKKDFGGNLCFVKWFGKFANLHQVWDSRIIESSKLSFTELTSFIDKPEDVKKVNVNSKAMDWAMESSQLLKSIYPPRLKNKKNKPMQYCTGSVASKYQPRLGFDYRNQHLLTVKRRLLQAGVRLAHKLNGFLDK